MAKRAASNNDNRKEPVRLVALSDGLFATVLTLLVLDLRLPEALSSQSLDRAAFLKWVGPHLFSYLLTFFVAGIYWLAHHRDFDHVVRYDRSLLGYNLLFLLFVGLLPFSTAAVSLGSYKNTDYPFYWAIYCANIVLAGAMLTLTWAYAVSHNLVDSEMTPALSRQVTARRLVTPMVFLLSIIVQIELPHAIVGPYTLLLIPPAQWVADRITRSAADDQLPAPTSLGERLWRAGTMLLWILIIVLAAWTSSL